MTVIRLREGELFLHSPVALDPELQREPDALGTVPFAVAPNRMHHLFIRDYIEAYPKAALFAAPGPDTKRKDVGCYAVLGVEEQHTPVGDKMAGTCIYMTRSIVHQADL